MSNGSGVTANVSGSSKLNAGEDITLRDKTETTTTYNENTAETIAELRGLFDSIQQEHPILAKVTNFLITISDNQTIVIQGMKKELHLLYNDRNHLNVALAKANSNYDVVNERNKHLVEKVDDLQEDNESKDKKIFGLEKRVGDLEKSCIVSMRLKFAVAVCAVIIAFVFIALLGAGLVWVVR